MAKQLILNLPVRAALGRGDFFISAANSVAVERLDATNSWPNAKLVLVGPKGAGKSHLAHVWAGAGGARVVHAADIGGLDIASIDGPLAIDDAQDTAQADEEALFHLHNHMVHAGLSLLLTARTPPARWSLHLPDLASRMQASDIARIEAPDDALLGAMLVKLFADRQLSVSPGAIRWIVTHAERSFAAIQQLVPALDAAALSEKRAITQSLAADVLDKLGEDAR